MSKLTDKFVRESDSKKCVGKIGMFISQTRTQNYLTMKKNSRCSSDLCRKSAKSSSANGFVYELSGGEVYLIITLRPEVPCIRIYTPGDNFFSSTCMPCRL